MVSEMCHIAISEINAIFLKKMCCGIQNCNVEVASACLLVVKTLIFFLSHTMHRLPKICNNHSFESNY